MSITRRQFTVSSAVLVSLTILGQAGRALGEGDTEDSKKKRKPRIPKEPYLIGPPEKYRKPGVYTEYNETHRLWVMSNGKRVVGFADVCTHLGCGMVWSAELNLLDCPCHTTQFDATGKPQAGGMAKRSLDRYALDLVDSPDGKQIQVSPRERLREDKGQWEDPRASVEIPPAK